MYIIYLRNKYTPSTTSHHSTLHHHGGMRPLLHLHQQDSTFLPVSRHRRGSGYVAELFDAFQERVEMSQPL